MFGPDITIDDLTITRISSKGLLIEIDNGTTTGSILIEDQFNYAAGGGHVELIEFDDTSTYRLDDKNYTLYGTQGNDTLNGVHNGSTGQDDIIYGVAGNNTIFGGDGDDTLYGGSGNDKIYGEAGHDTIYSGAGNNQMYGGAGNDVIYSGAGDNYVEVGAGDDIVHYLSGKDTYKASGGTDKIVLDAACNEIDPFYIKAGNDLWIWFDDDNSITLNSFFGGPSVRSRIFPAANDNRELSRFAA